MFIHETHLPQVLTPEQYTSPAHLDRELGELFHDGWHVVGARSDVPKDGDFFTFALFGKPLLIWNRGGELHAFLNVCPHRFSLLTHQGCGHAPDRLQCQYHGWEFDETGNTRKIPDARSFKPMKQGELGLIKHHAAAAGDLIFVNLSEDPPPLQEFLGSGYAVAEELFPRDRRLIMTMDYEVDCNWKIKIENSLESYHVDFIHQKTFRATPEAEICFHEFGAGWTTYATTQKAERKIDHWLNLLVHRLARTEFDEKYKHYHYYPNLMYGKMGLFTFAETVFPLAPNRTRIFGKFYVDAGPRGRLGNGLLYRALRRWGRKFWQVVVEEDTSVMPDIQKGMDSNEQPSRGLISIREERLFHFQEYVRDNTLIPSENSLVMS